MNVDNGTIIQTPPDGLKFVHDDTKPLYPKYVSLNQGWNRQQRRRAEAKLRSAKKRAKRGR